MKLSFYAVVSLVNKSEKFLIKIPIKDYRFLRKRLFVLDRRLNRKKKGAKTYPLIEIKNNMYLVYGVMKLMRIEDIVPLDLSQKIVGV